MHWAKDCSVIFYIYENKIAGILAMSHIWLLKDWQHNVNICFVLHFSQGLLVVSMQSSREGNQNEVRV